MAEAHEAGRMLRSWFRTRHDSDEDTLPASAEPSAEEPSGSRFPSSIEVKAGSGMSVLCVEAQAEIQDALQEKP